MKNTKGNTKGSATTIEAGRSERQLAKNPDDATTLSLLLFCSDITTLLTCERMAFLNYM